MYFFFWNWSSCPWRVKWKHMVQSPTIPRQINFASGQTRASPPTDHWAWICWCSSMRYSSLFSPEDTMSLFFASPDIWPLAYAWTGHILWDWQQKRELWEKEAALLHAPAGHSWWCKVSQPNVCWKPIHQRGGVKSQHLDGANAGLQR